MKVQSSKFEVQGSRFGTRCSKFPLSHPHISRNSRNSRIIPLLVFLLCGCSGPRPLRGGHATTAGPISQSIVQGENPSVPSRQDQETIKIRTYTLPAGTRVEQSPPDSDASTLQRFNASTSPGPIPSHSSHPSHSTAPPPSTINYQLSTPLIVTEREETRAKTELGAAQKDTAREFAAKLSSLKGIVWVGLALFLFGLASFFWPPLKALIGSVTTSAAITLGGVALMVLPTLIVGNELLILGGVALAVGCWFLAHRHGQLRGLLAAVSPLPTQNAASTPVGTRSTASPK